MTDYKAIDQELEEQLRGRAEQKVRRIVVTVILILLLAAVIAATIWLIPATQPAAGAS